MTQSINPADTLATRARRLKQAMQDSASGPLLVAQEIVAIAANWSSYREEAGGVSCSSWCEKIFGQNLAFFQRRYEAVRRLGEDSRRTWHHLAAVWACGQTDDDLALQRLHRLVLRARLDNGHNALSAGQVQRLAPQVFGKVDPKPVVCARCKRLEEFIREKGLKVPE